jgi:hypothetical protein
MKRPTMYRLLLSKFWIPLIAGGVMFETGGGCDPTVRTTILSGLQTSFVGLTTSLINAFFMSLAGNSSSGGSTSQPTSVVQAVFHSLPNWLA